MAIPGFLKFKACCVLSPKIGVLVAAGISVLLSILAWIVVGTVPADPFIVKSNGIEFKLKPAKFINKKIFGDDKAHKWDNRIWAAVLLALFPLFAALASAASAFLQPRKLLGFVAAGLHFLGGLWGFVAFIVYCVYTSDCQILQKDNIKPLLKRLGLENKDYCVGNAAWGLTVSIFVTILCFHFVCVTLLWTETTEDEQKETEMNQSEAQA